MSTDKSWDDALDGDSLFTLLKRACLILQAGQIARDRSWHLPGCGGPYTDCSPRCDALAHLLWDAQNAGVVLPRRAEMPDTGVAAAGSVRALHFVGGKGLR